MLLAVLFVTPPAHARGATARTVVGMRQVLDIACRPGGTCLGVGNNGQQGAVVLLNASGTIGPVRVVAGTTGLQSVLCPPVGPCLAVGQGPTAGVVVELSSDGTPGVVRLVGATGLHDVACPTSTTCLAVGRIESGSTAHPSSSPTPVYVVITNGQPGRARAFPQGTSSLISGIACPTATRCLAVGQGSVALLSSANGAWGATLARDPSSWTAGSGFPTQDISCPSATVCHVTASDSIATPEGSFSVPATMELTPDGVAKPVRRLSDRSGQLYGISCVAAGTCTVVGLDNVTAQGQSFHLSGGTLTGWVLWANSNYMSGVSCTAAQSCGLAGTMPLYGVFGWWGPIA